MDVTAAERTAIEAGDAKWTPPGEEFIAQCEVAGAVYNRATGYFELNGLTDITEEQMRVIMDAGRRQSSTLTFGYVNSHIRTHLPRIGGGQAASATDTFLSCFHLETVEMLNIVLAGNVFCGCSNLRSVGVKYSPYSLNAAATPNFQGCSKLVTLRGFIHHNNDIDLSECPLLSRESLEFMTTYAYNTAPIVITVHPDVYAKLTDTEEAGTLLPANLLSGQHGDGASNVKFIPGGVEISRVDKDTYFYLIADGTINLRAGQKLTLSMDVEGMAEGEEMEYRLAVSYNGAAPLLSGAVKLQNGRVGATVTVPKDMTISKFIIDDGSRAGLDMSLTTPIRMTNIKLSFGEHEELPYSPALSTIDDADLRERLMWADIVNTAASKNITFATT